MTIQTYATMLTKNGKNSRNYDTFFQMRNHYKKLKNVKSRVESYHSKSRIFSASPTSTRIVTNTDNPQSSKRNSDTLPEEVLIRYPLKEDTNRSSSSPKNYDSVNRKVSISLDCTRRFLAPEITNDNSQWTDLNKMVSEHEYLVFSLRIIEELVQNRIFSKKEIEQVVDSHIEANLSRLDKIKMTNQAAVLTSKLQGSFEKNAAANVDRKDEELPPKSIAARGQPSEELADIECSNKSSELELERSTTRTEPDLAKQEQATNTFTDTKTIQLQTELLVDVRSICCQTDSNSNLSVPSKPDRIEEDSNAKSPSIETVKKLQLGDSFSEYFIKSDYELTPVSLYDNEPTSLLLLKPDYEIPIDNNLITESKDVCYLDEYSTSIEQVSILQQLSEDNETPSMEGSIRPQSILKRQDHEKTRRMTEFVINLDEKGPVRAKPRLEDELLRLATRPSLDRHLEQMATKLKERQWKEESVTWETLEGMMEKTSPVHETSSIEEHDFSSVRLDSSEHEVEAKDSDFRIGCCGWKRCRHKEGASGTNGKLQNA